MIADKPTWGQAELDQSDARSCQAPVPSLYALLPIGIGTEDCESLVSYLCRLALQHCVSVDDLVNKWLANYSSTDFSTWRHFSTWMKDGTVSVFSEERTPALRDALVSATGVKAVGLLSMASLDGVIDLAGMASARRRYCPLCYEAADVDKLFSPVLWDLKAVDCCPIHQVRLASCVCGLALEHRRPRWHRVHLPGVCRECGAVAYACNARAGVDRDVSSIDVWVANQSARLIAAVSGGERFSVSAMSENVRELACLVGDGFPFRAAAVCGFSKARLYDWIHSVRPIKYAPLLALCAAAGVDVLEALRGRFQPKGEVAFRYTPNRRPPDILALDDLRQRLADRLVDPECPSLGAVSKSLGYDRKTISQRLPNEAATLILRWRAARSTHTEANRREAESKIGAVANALRADGKAVTVRNVLLASGIFVGKGSRYEAAFRYEQDRSNDE